LFEFLHDGFHAFLVLAAVFRSGDDCGQIVIYDSFWLKTRDFPGNDAQRQSLGNSGFTDPGFADQDGIVFLAAVSVS
jgi:hypothetical protein